MPISRTETGFGPGGTGASAARVPGVPTFSSNDQEEITSANNEMVFTSSEGGPETITLDTGFYTHTELAAELQSKMNANNTLTGTGTLTFSCTYNTITFLHEIETDSGTIAFTYSGSDAGDTFGFTADASAALSITSDTSVVASDTIAFTFSDPGNSSVVTYALYNITDTGYIDTDGSASVAAVWATLANWNNGGAAGTVTVTGLASATGFTFKAMARNELLVETAWSADSGVMQTGTNIDYGPTSEALEREVTTGNTKIVLLGVTSGRETIAISGDTGGVPVGYYGDVVATYKLSNYDSTASRIAIEFSENGTDWSAATEGGSGDGLTSLTTTPAGVEHTVSWDSYTDAGTSELSTTTYFRITPYDASPSGGDAGAIRTSDVFVNNNRSAKITLLNADSREWDEDTTPVFNAIMGAIRGGTKLFWLLYVEDALGTEQFVASSAASVTGWEYEDSPDSWNAVPIGGVDVAHADGTNRVRYTVQAGDALSQDNDDPYNAYIKQGETRDHG